MNGPEYLTELWREQDANGTLFWVCDHPSLPGCMAQGESPDEALADLDEARELYLSAMEKHGLPVPPGEGKITVHIQGIRVYPD
jgi:predicted RNase H-like HicB family nuclease